MQTLRNIKEQLESRGLAPRKRLGQNFLIDQNLVRKLIEASGVGEGDLVLEVGPGTGVLTDALVAAGARVVASELDAGLADLLRDRFSERITLVEGDCLSRTRSLAPAVADALGGESFTLVANLPYACASPLISSLLCDFPRCSALHVTIQREVADRLTAAPGTKAYGLLGIAAQIHAEVSMIAVLPPSCFWPRPDVTSAMVSLVRRPAPLVPDPHALLEMCEKLFAARRKQIGSVLGRDLAWPEGIAATVRAEELEIEQLQRVYEARSHVSDEVR